METIDGLLRTWSAELPSPIQMCDGLSHAAQCSEVTAGVEILFANRLAHLRRFVDAAENFPHQCRYVLEMLAACRRHASDAFANHSNHTSRPSPVLQESGKTGAAGFT